MKKYAVLFAILSPFSSVVFAEPPAAVPEGAIPIESRSETERDFLRNSNPEETLSDLDQQMPAMQNQSTTPAPRAFIQGEAPTRNSEAPPIEPRSVMRNPNAK